MASSTDTPSSPAPLQSEGKRISHHGPKDENPQPEIKRKPVATKTAVSDSPKNEDAGAKRSQDSKSIGTSATANEERHKSVAASIKSTTDVDSVNPSDFHGEVQTTNELPTIETLRKIETYTVLDRDGKSRPFKSLYAGHNVARRVLIIFIRHFFCGNCQEYLRTLSANVTPDALLQLPVSTFIAVIGCGSPELIDAYIEETNCPFPVYADPTRRLYTELGMVRTLAMGTRPAYLQDKTLAHTVISGVVQGLKQVKSGLVMKMGDQRQVGGEFLFEPSTLSLDTPITTPKSEVDRRLGEPFPTVTATSEHRDDKLSNHDDDGADRVEEKCITWCHRMRTTRDHVEIPELMEVLGLDGNGTPIRDQKRWTRALRERKGTGLSMASQMSRLSIDTTHVNGSGGGSIKDAARAPSVKDVARAPSVKEAVRAPSVKDAAKA
ncbi:AhpC/TSA antioxidant enzyme-domain-containing protein [Whalleya microplaca]|nr:AhpC/TSA antioxidant enzyme-domain-containing protein [Whalleya microplaca]